MSDKVTILQEQTRKFIIHPNIVLKCDVVKNLIIEIMGFFRVLRKNNIQKAYLPNISIPGQIAFEISAQSCSDDSIQILLIT